MRAFMCYEPHRAELIDLPIPTPAPDEVLVRVGAASLCHSDLDIIDGRRTHALRLPVVLGHEFAGTVEALGSDISGIQAGQKVACECIVWCGRCRACVNGETSCCERYNEIGTTKNGGFAEYTAVPARMVHPIHNISLTEASNVEPAGNGCHAAQSARIRPGDTVVVIGPGPIGLYALQFARLYQPEKLIMVGTRDTRLAVARELGATHTVNIRTADAYQEIMALTDGRGADRVIQCATTDDAVELALKILCDNSVLAVEGYSSGKLFPIDFGDFIRRPLSIIGVNGVTHQNYIDTVRAAEAGQINFRSIITHTFPLSRIGEALEVMRDKSSNAIKIAIEP